jgi:aspartate-semialdehyde dehydrogenase
MGDRIDVAVLGATGSVGQRYVELLGDHPQFRLAELFGSERSAGRRYGDIADWRISAGPSEDAGNMVVKHHEEPVKSPIVFCSLPGGIAREAEARLAAEGHYVFSNARDNRMDAHVPLLIPEVNADHARAIKAQQKGRGWSRGFIVTNPNCSTIHLVLALKPVWDAFGIEQCLVTTMQASSGAGYPGVPSLDLIDNVVPLIGGEEEKMEIESRKLLGGYDGADFQYADLRISAMCNRAQPALDRDVANGMASIVGRVRECPVFDIKFVVLGHNTIRGAAGASILNAEMMVAEGYI